MPRQRNAADGADETPTQPEVLTAALELAGRGTPVFPVGPDKNPYTPHGFNDASKDEEIIRGWFSKWPQAGIATPTGPNWLVLDVDDPKALRLLEEKHGQLPPTREVVTPRPGRHMYFRGEATNSSGNLPAGIDVRGEGGYVLLPPSPHHNGGRYEWKNEDIEIAEAPAWLMKLLKPADQNGHAPAIEGEIPKLERNQTLASFAGSMRRRGMSVQSIAAALAVENRARCKPPLAEKEVAKIARSVGRYASSDDAVVSLGKLAALLGLAKIGVEIEHVRMFGRGSNAVVHIRLDSGKTIVFDPIGKFATITKMTSELALQASARPVLKQADLMVVLMSFNELGDHYDALEQEDRARDLGAEYLRAAAIAEVEMNDGGSRWEAFVALEEHARRPPPKTDIVLADAKTGIRYVRTGWFEGYLRSKIGNAEPVLRAMTSTGWTKAGQGGRIKATQPGFGRNLIWAFFQVQPGWEDE